MMDGISLKGQVVIMTGGGRGIGRAAALAMAQHGADVVVAARTASEIEQVANEIKTGGQRALAVPTDVTNPDQVKHLVDRTLAEFGQIDVLVNNAGSTGRLALVRYLTVEDWVRTIDTNLNSTFICSRAVLDSMIARRSGKIINVSSSLANATNILPGISAYSAAKAAIVHFSRILAAEVAEFSIQVNAVWPGLVNTTSTDEMRRATVEEAGPVFVERVRKNPWMTPEDCAPLFVFLASRASDDISGQFVLVNDPAIKERVAAFKDRT